MPSARRPQASKSGRDAISKRRAASAIAGRVTIVDIAAKLGLSATTVSRALREQPGMTQATRNRVKAAARHLGYVRNMAGAALSSGRTHSIIYVVPETAGRFPSLYHMDVLEGLVDELALRGYTLTVVSQRTLNQSGRSVFDVFKLFRADGAVLLLVKSDGPAPAQRDFPHPVVVVNRIIKNMNADFVVADDEDGAYRATQYLLQLGHRHIAHLAGPADNFNTQRRRRGYVRALTDGGLDVDPQLISTATSISEKAGRQAMRRLIDAEGSFTAVFCSVDVLALGAMRTLHERGLSVPDDVSLVSFDDDSFAGVLDPPLTTVRKPRYDMGRAASRLLMKRIEGRQALPSVTATLRTKLIVRGSAVVCTENLTRFEKAPH